MPRSAKQKAVERGLREARRLLERYERRDKALSYRFHPDEWRAMSAILTEDNRRWRDDLATYCEPTSRRSAQHTTP